MTSQITNIFVFRNKEYSLYNEIWNISDIGFVAEKWHTANYKGWSAKYEISNDVICLKQLLIKHAAIGNRNNPPELFGRNGVTDDQGITKYEMNESVKFDGEVDILDNFVDQLHVNQGFQDKWKYRTWLQLHVKNGFVVKIEDRSKENEDKINKCIDDNHRNKALADFAKLHPGVINNIKLLYESKSDDEIRMKIDIIKQNLALTTAKKHLDIAIMTRGFFAVLLSLVLMLKGNYVFGGIFLPVAILLGIPFNRTSKIDMRTITKLEIDEYKKYGLF